MSLRRLFFVLGLTQLNAQIFVVRRFIAVGHNFQRSMNRATTTGALSRIRKHQGIPHKPVARWHFDKGSGTVAEDTEGANDGTLGAGNADKVPTWNADGGLTFDGVDDTVKVPDSDTLDLTTDTLTVSVWVKRGSTTKSLTVVKKTDATNGYHFWVTPFGSIQFKIHQAGVSKDATSQTAIGFNKWYHLCARYNGKTLQLFIDGQKETVSFATTAATGALIGTTEPLWIGGDTTQYFNGSIDDLLIYDSALSDADIAYLSGDRAGLYLYDPVNFESHHKNGLGSPIVLTDGDQNVLARYDYDVFGAIRAETGKSDNVRKFTGKEYDSDVRLYYFAARYYDPYIGRFTQRDPAGDGVNWYTYTYNNPLKYVDPTGELAILFNSYFNGPKAHIGWDPDIQHFYVNDGDNTTWLSVARATSAIADLIPILGDGKGLIELFTGEDALTGEQLSKFDRFLGLVLLSEVRGVKKGASLADEALDAALDLATDVEVRISKKDGKRVRITRPDGSVIDITRKRVKAWEPEPRNPNKGTKRVKFDNPQPGSKGYKRDPTQAELNLLDKL